VELIPETLFSTMSMTKMTMLYMSKRNSNPLKTTSPMGSEVKEPMFKITPFMLDRIPSSSIRESLRHRSKIDLKTILELKEEAMWPTL
jgi:hypothetical protein